MTPLVYYGGDIVGGSDATPGLWNRRFSALSQNIDTVFASSGSNSFPTSTSTGDLLTYFSPSVLTRLPDVATGQVLVSGGLNTVPAYSASPTLTDLVLTGTLQVSGVATLSGGISLTGTIAYANLPAGGGTWANGGALSITGGVTTVAGLISSAATAVQFSAATAAIIGNTSDGSDTQQLNISAGGAASNTRGGTIFLSGNEHATTPGRVEITSGNNAAGDMLLRLQGVTFLNATRSGGVNTLEFTGILTASATAGHFFGVSAHSAATLGVGGAAIQLVLAENVTDATQKNARLGAKHYTNTEEPMAMLGTNAAASSNVLNIGGGTSVMNAATLIQFYGATDNVTTTGSIVGTIGIVAANSKYLLSLAPQADTGQIHGEVRIRAGTNAGANDQDAMLTFYRSSTELWRAGVLGSISTATTWRFRDVVNSITVLSMVPAANTADVRVGADFSTGVQNSQLVINSGTNAGANDKNSLVEWQRGQTALWRAGVLGSLAANANFTLRDVVNSISHTVFVTSSTLPGLSVNGDATTNNRGAFISVNAGTNSGANDKDAYFRWSRGGTELWHAGVLGSVTADSAIRFRDVVNSITHLQMAPSSSVPTARFYETFSTAAASGLVSVNAGTNSGANDQDSAFEWRRAQTAVWRAGVLGSVSTSDSWTLYDVGSSRRALVMNRSGRLFVHPDTNTANLSAEISLRAGTNSGANNKDARVTFHRSTDELWQMGVLGSLSADSMFRIYDPVNSVLHMRLEPSATSPTIGFFSALTTANTGGYVYVNAGTNAGANDKDSAFGWQVGQDEKWRAGVLGASVGANFNWTLRDVDNGVTPLIIAASTGAATFLSTVSATQYTSTIATGTAPLVVASTTEVANLHAATATVLHTARTINGVSFNGSANIEVVAAIIGGGSLGAGVGAGLTRYVSPSTGSGTGSATEGSVQFPLSRAGTVGHLRVRTASAQPASGTCVYTIYQNGSPTTITLTIAAGAAAGDFSDTSHSVAFAEGDRLTLEIVNNASGAAAGLAGWSVIVA